MTAVFWQNLTQAVFEDDVTIPEITYTGRLAGPLPVSELLAETTALAGTALTRLMDIPSSRVRVDARLCAFWGLTSCKPIGWTPPDPWDPFSAIFKGANGWIRLHTNAPHHKAAALKVLGAVSTKDEVAEAISKLDVAALEQSIIDAGGAAAQAISWAEWQKHPQGLAIAQTPLVEWAEKSDKAPAKLQQADYSSVRPLAGLRVLDLTRVLAGPVPTRTLAGYGADVLRIDPKNWDDPGLLQDTTIGKHCAKLDLFDTAGRARFEELLRQADVFVHGFRPGVLEKLGYDQATRDRINPLLIDISLSAYGWQGPWATRRGFDSLVQFSAGIAELCGDANGAPGKLPVQALDHAAGYIMAACCLQALKTARSGRIMTARTSLASIAWMLCQEPLHLDAREPIPSAAETDFVPQVEQSDWGDLKRLHAPLAIEGVPMHWDIEAGELRRHPANWRS